MKIKIVPPPQFQYLKNKPVPAFLLGHLIPDADIIYMAAGNEYCLFQELTVNGFMLLYSILHTAHKHIFQHSLPQESAVLHYMIKGRLDVIANGMPPRQIKSQQSLLYIQSENPFALHCHTGSCHLLQIYFSVSFLQKLSLGQLPPALFPPQNSSRFNPLLLDCGKRMHTIFKTLLSTLYLQPFRWYELNRHCMLFLHQFIKRYGTVQHKKDWSKKKALLLVDLEAYIDAHLSYPHTLLSTHSLAKRMRLSNYAFKALFQKSLGLSPAHFIETKRMQNAMQLLKASAINVSQVAAANGYSDLSSFSRAFKKYFGKPPSSFWRSSD